MKQHLKLKLKREATVTKIPYWQDIIHDKAMAQITIEPEIDRILTKFNLPVWQTREYKPALKTWDSKEKKSGLNRIYRLILQRNTSIPQQMIEEISLLPIVEEVSIGRIGQSDLPSMQVMGMSLNTDRRSRQAIFLHKAHQFSQGDPRIIVAVLDTGLDLDHSEYRENLLPHFNYLFAIIISEMVNLPKVDAPLLPESVEQPIDKLQTDKSQKSWNWFAKLKHISQLFLWTFKLKLVLMFSKKNINSLNILLLISCTTIVKLQSPP